MGFHIISIINFDMCYVGPHQERLGDARQVLHVVRGDGAM